MDWSDSVFREHPKYFGDIEFSADNIIGDNGIVSSKKYMAFRYNKKIGVLSTDFETHIDEKLASGRKAEYGSKVYTTSNIDTIDINGADINVLQFDPYNDNNIICGDSKGILNIFDITSSNKSILNVNELSSSIYSLSSHPSSSEVLVIGGLGNINIIDLTKNGQSLVSTKIMDGDDEIINMQFSPNSNYLRCITKNKYLFQYDPRTDNAIENCLKLRYSPNNIVNLSGDTQISIGGLTSYLEPIIYGYDISSKLDDKLHENYIFKESYNHKQCKPFLKYDNLTQCLYLTFQSCSDVIVLNKNNNFEKEALYHSVSDGFMGFDILPKSITKKREINRIIKFAKNRIQQIIHTRGGKLIYEKLTNSPKKSISSVNDYFLNKKNIKYNNHDIGKLVAVDFEEEKKRSVSLYIHVTGKESTSNYEKYFDLKISQTVNCNLGMNLRINSKYALYPSPTYGGGALGVIKLSSFGRKKQCQLSAHNEKITTFDICRIDGNEDLVITGSPDCKAIISRINENSASDQISKCDKLYTFSCSGKVTFVGFHPRIRNLCIIASNKDGQNNESNIYLYNYNEGKLIKEIKMDNIKNIMDIQFESIIGLIAAISSSNGIIKLIDIRQFQILSTFKCDTNARDTKLFWSTNTGQNKPKYFNQLICLGFGKGSVRKFSLYDLTDIVTSYYNNNCNINIDELNELNESKQDDNDNIDDDNDDNDDNIDDEKKSDDDIMELESIATQSFGVSNSIPIGYYDSNDNLFYVSSIGDRKIRVYELNMHGIKPMNASYQSQQDIMGIDFGLKQLINIFNVELCKCYKLTKDCVISPISFYIPRKRKEYFQDDLYSQVLDIKNKPIDGDIINNIMESKNNKLSISLSYLSLKPNDMELLSNAPLEKLSEHQKRRNSQIKLMEAAKLKEQPQSTEQAFDQFSRMVADAPTQNRWDAQNIGSEVAEDEWSD